MNRVSIVIPVLNEEASLAACLAPLQKFRLKGYEIIVVDGGSRDNTIEVARGLADIVLSSECSRAKQMNAGAKKATGGLLLFLHADTILPSHLTEIMGSLPDKRNLWGRFDVRLSGRHYLYRVIGFCMNARSRFSGIATGDQAIFVSRLLFGEIGGFPEIPLMEDIAISGKLKRICAPVCLRDKVVTSSRRWERYGILKTILKMWYLRLRYTLGSDVTVLANEYEP